MKSFFINEAFDKAIKDYNSSKSSPEGVLYNSFLVMVIRMLVNIYNEADIINPSIVNNENAFDNNLMKYGASKEDVDKLKRYLDGYYLIEKRNKSSVRREDNIYFVEVQKLLIDLFNIKRLNYDVSDNKIKEFFSLLYTPGTSNVLRLSYNYLNAENIYEVAEYYNEKMKVKKEDKKEEKDLLAFDVYKKFNVSVKELSKMNNGEINELNSEIYKSLDINENAINKEFELNRKLNELTKEPITTGNGYVDILLIMSIIVTVVMVVVIFSTIVF